MQRSEAMPACNSYVVVPFRPGTFAARRTRMPCTRLAAVPHVCTAMLPQQTRLLAHGCQYHRIAGRCAAASVVMRWVWLGRGSGPTAKWLPGSLYKAQATGQDASYCIHYRDTPSMSQPPPYGTPSNPDRRPLPQGWIEKYDER